MNMSMEEFESWYSGVYGYGDAHKKDMLEAWKASRAALCVELPEGDGGSQDTNLIAVEVALDNAGVPYK